MYNKSSYHIVHTPGIILLGFTEYIYTLTQTKAYYNKIFFSPQTQLIIEYLYVVILFYWYFHLAAVSVTRAVGHWFIQCLHALMKWPRALSLAYSVCSLTPVSARVVSIAESFCYIWYLLLLISFIVVACINLRLEVRKRPPRSARGNVLYQSLNHTVASCWRECRAVLITGNF